MPSAYNPDTGGRTYHGMPGQGRTHPLPWAATEGRRCGAEVR